jgi:hypothetical protein
MRSSVVRDDSTASNVEGYTKNLMPPRQNFHTPEHNASGI